MVGVGSARLVGVAPVGGPPLLVSAATAVEVTVASAPPVEGGRALVADGYPGGGVAVELRAHALPLVAGGLSGCRNMQFHSIKKKQMCFLLF